MTVLAQGTQSIVNACFTMTICYGHDPTPNLRRIALFKLSLLSCVVVDPANFPVNRSRPSTATTVAHYAS